MIIARMISFSTARHIIMPLEFSKMNNLLRSPGARALTLLAFSSYIKPGMKLSFENDARFTLNLNAVAAGIQLKMKKKLIFIIFLLIHLVVAQVFRIFITSVKVSRKQGWQKRYSFLQGWTGVSSVAKIFHMKELKGLKEKRKCSFVDYNRILYVQIGLVRILTTSTCLLSREPKIPKLLPKELFYFD